HLRFVCFFLSSATATPLSYTLSLHDALPICRRVVHGLLRLSGLLLALLLLLLVGLPARGRQLRVAGRFAACQNQEQQEKRKYTPDRKSTRLNSSHVSISYAVFCLTNKRGNRR